MAEFSRIARLRSDTTGQNVYHPEVSVEEYGKPGIVLVNGGCPEQARRWLMYLKCVSTNVISVREKQEEFPELEHHPAIFYFFNYIDTMNK